MMIIFNIFQTVIFYGFLYWVPALVIKQGITINNTLFYTTLIALAAPIRPSASFIPGADFRRSSPAS